MVKRSKSKTKAHRAPEANVDERILDAAMALAADEGWRAVTPDAIAARAGLSEADVEGRCPDRGALLKLLAARADAALASGTSDRDEPRDRVFDAVMKRFDALQPYRKGIAAALRGQFGDPRGALGAACGLRQSMARTLEAAGIEADGLLGALRVKGLGLIYLDALRVFVGDDSADLGKTMATLDKRLKFADRLVGALAGAGLGPRAAA